MIIARCNERPQSCTSRYDINGSDPLTLSELVLRTHLPLVIKRPKSGSIVSALISASSYNINNLAQVHESIIKRNSPQDKSLCLEGLLLDFCRVVIKEFVAQEALEFLQAAESLLI